MGFHSVASFNLFTSEFQRKGFANSSLLQRNNCRLISVAPLFSLPVSCGERMKSLILKASGDSILEKDEENYRKRK